MQTILVALILSKNTIETIGSFFSVVEKEDLIKELHKLNPKKITQETDIPVKTLKDNKDFFVGYF